jgi:hypothetical protein
MINRLLTQRLISLYDPFKALNLPRNIRLATVEPLGYSEKRDARYDRGRVRYFLEALQDGQELEPIAIDNTCVGMRVLPEPVLLDGHHRLIAYVLSGRKRIPSSYSGRVDLLRYLEGKRKTCPQG